TIELRVCDTPLNVERAAAIAGYLQSLCHMLLAREEPAPTEDDYLVYHYNRFQACRFGLDGILVHPRSHQKIRLREDILATLRCLAPHAALLDAQAALDEIHRVAMSENHAQWLRRRGREAGLSGMVESAVSLFRSGVES
ncbi:MAG: glutamate--cysteine ligase, partial [Rhodocyclaceae bacterium]